MADNSSDSTQPADDIWDVSNPSILSSNSKKSCNWVINLWKRWMLGLQECGDKTFASSLDMLFTNFRSVLNDQLPRFFNEIRRADGSNFPVIHFLKDL